MVSIVARRISGSSSDAGIASYDAAEHAAGRRADRLAHAVRGSPAPLRNPDREWRAARKSSRSKSTDAAARRMVGRDNSAAMPTAVSQKTIAGELSAASAVARQSRSSRTASQPNARTGCGSQRGSPMARSSATPSSSSGTVALTGTSPRIRAGAARTSRPDARSSAAWAAARGWPPSSSLKAIRRIRARHADMCRVAALCGRHPAAPSLSDGEGRGAAAAARSRPCGSRRRRNEFPMALQLRLRGLSSRRAERFGLAAVRARAPAAAVDSTACGSAMVSPII